MNYTEIENDIEISDDKEAYNDANITNPFSTKDIKITHATIALSSLLKRLEYNEVDLNPDFQRHADLWTRSKMSRLIESVLLKLPLPVFYFDVSNQDKWIVVDGLQRLSTLKKFVVDQDLKLNKLEFLKDLDGKKYNDLDRSLKRIIDETQIITYQIEAQTPKEVRYSIFNRINTGGLALNAQEIRQALNQKGQGIKFLENVTQNEKFKKIVDISSKRMSDRELVLRFVAFKLMPFQDSKFTDMGSFLDSAMEKLDHIQDEQILKQLEKEFISSLEYSEQVLGENHRFSRSIGLKDNTNTLNRSLFDVLSVSFSEISDQVSFLQKKDVFVHKFKSLLQDINSDFSKSITEGTSSKGAVETRFRIIKDLINEVLNEQN